jgi:integrase
LPPLALKVLARQPRFADDDRVFVPVSGKCISAARGMGVMREKLPKDMERWTVHDCRRTARSLMSRAGVQSEHAERVMGHVIAGIEGVYDRHPYVEEKRMALAKLAALIGTIINPPADNVRSIAAGRA